ncbi:uncharacterized protein LOC142518299 [Primulina tabacum]|uniref:uncharacterized protein LOC142518299 n=1 Tax=Primulina tabacum TaxID=48773 RepID=UPI003F596463
MGWEFGPDLYGSISGFLIITQEAHYPCNYDRRERKLLYRREEACRFTCWLKKKACSSSFAPKRASSTPPQAESHPPSGKEKASTDPGSSVQKAGKRKISEISVSSTLSTKESGSEDEHPSGPAIHPSYTPESAIMGRGPTHIAHKLLFQLPSSADATFLGSLGWSDLSRQTYSSLTESIMYLGELVERADLIRSSACHDLREGKVLHDQLQATIDEVRETHVGELSELQA